MTLYCRSSWKCLLLAGGLAVLAGCGGNEPELGLVQGRVTLDGKPLPDAMVMFLPEARGRPGTAFTDVDGRYELRFNRMRKGALLGRHQVTISTFAPPTLTLDERGRAVSQAARPERLPKRYHEQTELSAEVTTKQTSYDFDLKSN